MLPLDLIEIGSNGQYIFEEVEQTVDDEVEQTVDEIEQTVDDAVERTVDEVQQTVAEEQTQSQPQRVNKTPENGKKMLLP